MITLNYSENSMTNRNTLHIVIFMICLIISSNCLAQSKNDSTKVNTKSVQKDNFLDMGAGTLSQLFGENLDGQSPNKKLSFLEILEKMDMPMEQKAEYTNLYYLQAKDLTEKQKDSIGKSLEKKIMEAKNNPENKR